MVPAFEFCRRKICIALRHGQASIYAWTVREIATVIERVFFCFDALPAIGALRWSREISGHPFFQWSCFQFDFLQDRHPHDH